MRKSQIKDNPFLFDLLGGDEGITRTFRVLMEGPNPRITEEPDPNDGRGKRYTANYGRMPKYLLDLGTFPRKCSMAADEVKAAALVAFHSLGKATALKAFQERVAEFESRKNQAAARIYDRVVESEKMYLDILLRLYVQNREALNDAYKSFIFGESAGLIGLDKAAENPDVKKGIEKMVRQFSH